MNLPALVAAAGGILACIFLVLALRKSQVRLDQVREEFLIMMHQQQTEYRNGLGEVNRALIFLEQSAQTIEDATQGRLTNSVRSQAIQLLRTGMPPEKAASTLGVGKCEMRLIARVSGILAAH